jgi:hypothetical protein
MDQPCGICDSLINISRAMYNHVVTSAISVVLIVWVSRSFRDWLRHRSPAAGERVLFKKRLPNWVNIANTISWLIPPVRKANELAMTGLPAASYAQLNRGLLLLLAWLAPLCLAATLLGVIDPWL